MQNRVATIARVLFVLPFGAFGISHLTHARAMAEKLPPWLPGGQFWIYFTGVCLVLACVSFLSRIQAGKAALGMAAFLVMVILTLHIPALFAGNPQMARMNLLKDVSLMGGALTYAVIFSRKEESVPLAGERVRHARDEKTGCCSTNVV